MKWQYFWNCGAKELIHTWQHDRKKTIIFVVRGMFLQIMFLYFKKYVLKTIYLNFSLSQYYTSTCYGCVMFEFLISCLDY